MLHRFGGHDAFSGRVDADGHTGRAEAAGVDRDGELPQTMAARSATAPDRLHDRFGGAELMQLLPAGPADQAGLLAFFRIT